MRDCNDRKCSGWNEDYEHNCWHMDPSTYNHCFKPLKEKTEPVAEVPCSAGLYGAVQWINDKPVLDGMPYFETKEACIGYASQMGGRPTPPGISVRYTIIRLERAI